MAHDLYGHHDGCEPPDRTHKLLYIFEAVNFYPHNMSHNKHNEGHGNGRIEIACWRFKAGNYAEQIGNQYEDGQRSYEGEIPLPTFAHCRNHTLIDAIYEQFHNVLESSGIDREAPRGHKGNEDKQNHDKPRVCHMGRKIWIFKK